MPLVGQTRSSTSQIRNLTLPLIGNEYKWIETAINPLTNGETVSSTIGRLLGETLKNEQNRSGGIGLQFDPPRRRSSFSITDVQVNLPPLATAFFGEGETAASAKGTFGWLASLVIGGIPTYSEPIIPTSFSLTSTASTDFKSIPALAQQLQFNQTLAIGPGESIEIRIDSYYILESVVKGTNFIVHCPGTVAGVKTSPAITSVIVYDLTTT